VEAMFGRWLKPLLEFYLENLLFWYNHCYCCSKEKFNFIYKDYRSILYFPPYNIQEPAFQELILLYTDGGQSREIDDEELPLQLKIYERIPIPDLPVIFNDNI
jgi:hypothetical protein